MRVTRKTYLQSRQLGQPGREATISSGALSGLPSSRLPQARFLKMLGTGAALGRLIGGCILVSCAPSLPGLGPSAEAPLRGVAAPPTPPTNLPRGTGTPWPGETWSPRPSRHPSEASLQQGCGWPDQSLEQVAQGIADRRASGAPALEAPELEFALHAAGLPYVWAKAWTLNTRQLTPEATSDRLHRWLASFAEGGERRCGLARSNSAQGEILAVIAVDVLADLEPIPTQVRLGQWLRLRAHLHPDATAAEIILLGPRGLPRSVPTSVQDGLVQAAFSLDAPGSWVVQILATTERGPRPVAEANIEVGGPPPATYVSQPVPGEFEPIPGALQSQETSTSPSLLEAHLFRMLNAARATERAPQVRWDARLHALAQAHAGAMRRAQRIGHNLGQGDPRARLDTAALPLLTGGENVAHATTVVRAHRALWSSPSHRSNLLHHRFTSVGIGVAEDTDGSVWVCELFGRFLEE